MEKGKWPLMREIKTVEKAISVWSDLLNSCGVGGELSPTNRDDFFLRIIKCQFGKSDLFLYQTNAVRHFQMQKERSLKSGDVFILSCVKKGRVVVEQRNQKTLIETGDCFLVYSGEPFCRRFMTPCEIVSFVISRQLLQRWLLFPADITATSLMKASPFGKPLAAVCAALTQLSFDQMSVTPDAIVEQVCCFLALIAGPPKAVASTYKQASFHRHLQVLRTHCCERNFNQAAFAREQGVSVRTLQAVFCAAGTSFRRELLALRMERALWILDNSKYDQKSISEIAHHLGYRHANHFITHFRHVFGIPPAAYRKTRKT